MFFTRALRFFFIRNTSILALFILFVSAQELDIPPNWQHTNATNSQEALADIVQAGLHVVSSVAYHNNTDDVSDPLNGLFNGFAVWDSPQMLWTMALKDRIAGTKDNVNVIAAIKAFGRSFPGFQNDTIEGLIRTPVNFGMAAITAYQAYNDPTMLAAAELAWNSAAPLQISLEQAASGRIPSKSFEFDGSCGLGSVAGGVFFNMKKNGTDISADVHNNFMLLSAHLANLTSNQTYLDAALLAANFTSTQLFDPATRLIITDLQVANANAACEVNPQVAKQAYQSGSFIEALSILANVTDDARWTSLMLELLNSSVNYDWPTTPNGVMQDVFQRSDDDFSYKGLFIRSLHEPWSRTNRSDVRTLISAFTNVQANAVLQNATFSDTNIYAATFTGPPTGRFTSAGALTALPVLVAAIGVALSTPSNASGPGTPATITKSSGRRFANKLALGLGVGLGIAFIICATAALWFVIVWHSRRPRRCADSESAEKHKNLPTVAIIPEPPKYLFSYTQDSTQLTFANSQSNDLPFTSAMPRGASHPFAVAEASLSYGGIDVVDRRHISIVSSVRTTVIADKTGDRVDVIPTSPLLSAPPAYKDFRSLPTIPVMVKRH